MFFRLLIILLFSVLITTFSLLTLKRLPSSWFCDYGIIPKKLLLSKSNSYKLILFTFIFSSICLYIIFASNLPQYLKVIHTIMLIIFLHISISDILFRVIPDQHIVAVFLLSFLNLFHGNILFHIKGLFAGFLPYFIMLILGVLIQKKEIIGFGDIKLMTALGLFSGTYKIISIYIISSLFSGILSFFIVLILSIKHSCTKECYIPLAPFICFSFFFSELF